MTNDQNIEQHRYKAFLSYSHVDRGLGEWLHKQLESYRIPKILVGQPTPTGPIPSKLFPIFRDRDELPSSGDLNEEIKQALANSDFLIVICSPAAASSRWVNEEVLSFKRLGRSARILAFIIAGEPGGPKDVGAGEPAECFPEALKYALGADGNLTNKTVDVGAADARPQGDGEEDAKLKIIAGLIGVGFDVLKQREREAARRRARIRAAVYATVAILSFAAVGGGWLAWNNIRASQIAQSQKILEESAGLDPALAIPRLLEALPQSIRYPNRPYVETVASQLALSFAGAKDALILDPGGVGQIQTIRFATKSPVLLAQTISAGPSTVATWDIPSGTRRLTRTFDGGLFDAAISADGRLVAVPRRISGAPLLLLGMSEIKSGQLDETRLWLPEDGSRHSYVGLSTYLENGTVVIAFGGFGAVSPGFASLDPRSGRIFDFQPSCSDPSFSKRRILAGGTIALIWCDQGKSVQLWKLGRNLQFVTLEGTNGEYYGVEDIERIAVSRDIKYLAIDVKEDGNVAIHRVSDGGLVGKYKLPDRKMQVFSFVGNSNDLLVIFDDAKGNLIKENGTVFPIDFSKTKAVDAVAEAADELSGTKKIGLSQDGKTILLMRDDKDAIEVRRWDTGELIARDGNVSHNNISLIASIATTPGSFLVAYMDGTVERRSGETAKVTESWNLSPGPFQNHLLTFDGKAVLIQNGNNRLCRLGLVNEQSQACIDFTKDIQSFSPMHTAESVLVSVEGKSEIRSFAPDAPVIEIRAPDVNATIEAAAFDDAGSLLAIKANVDVSENYRLYVIDLASRAIKRHWDNLNGSLTELDFDPTGRYLVALHRYSDNGIQVFDVSQDQPLWAKKFAVDSIAFRGDTLLVGNQFSGTQAFNIKTGEDVIAQDNKREAIVGISADSSITAVRSNNSIILRSKDKPLSQNQELTIYGLASLSFDGRYIALSDRTSKSIRVRSSGDSSAPVLGSLSGPMPVAIAAFTANGERLLTVSDGGQITLIDASKLSKVASTNCNCGGPVSVFMDNSNADRAMIVGSEAAIMLQLPQLNIEKRITFPNFSIVTAAASEDLNVVALEGSKKSLRLLFPREARIETIVEDEQFTVSTSEPAAWLSRDGRSLAYARMLTMYIQSFSNRGAISKIPISYVLAAAFDRSGKNLAISQLGNKLTVVDVETGHELFTSPTLSFTPVSGDFIGQSQDKLLLGTNGGSIWVTSAKEFQEPVALTYPTGGSFATNAMAAIDERRVVALHYGVSFNPDDWNKILIWNAETRLPEGQLRFRRVNPGSKPKIVVSGDGKRALVFRDGSTAHLVDLRYLKGQELINEACLKVILPLTPAERESLGNNSWIEKLYEIVAMARFSDQRQDVRPAICPPPRG